MLEEFAAVSATSSATGHAPVAVTACYRRSADAHLLAFRLTNLSKVALTLLPYELPWGNPHSITLAAITTDGRRLLNRYRIADPSYSEEKVTIAPGQSIEGEYDLKQVVEIAEAPKDKNILVFWAYPVPSDAGDARHICSGVVVILKE